MFFTWFDLLLLCSNWRNLEFPLIFRLNFEYIFIEKVSPFLLIPNKVIFGGIIHCDLYATHSTFLGNKDGYIVFWDSNC